MSEDGLSDPNDEPSMELFIETLTGTSFEMRVFPTDTVLDIKNKIHRDEGIPVHHQNLLFQMKELQDYARLSDVGIVSGSTLKMVLSMRGGPISTRRLNTCDHHIIWKDLKDLIEHTRDEVGDKSGSKVSVVVFKEGEVINVIRVIENEDGTYSPYTEKAISPPYSRHKERDDVQQTFFKKISEDMEMASKIHVLKSKMKKLRQQRNSKEVGDADGKAETSKSDVSYLLPKPVGAGGDFLSYETNPSTSRSVENSRSSKRLTFDERIAHDSLLDHLENGEIALKEKHRSRIRLGPNDKIKKVEKHRTVGDAKPYFCKKLHVFGPDKKETTDDEKLINSSILSPLYNRIPPGERHRRPTPFDNNNFDDGKHPEPISILKDQDHTNHIEMPCSETLSLSARNRVHLARLVLPDAEHGKSSPDSIELDENSQEMWEIQPDNLKSGGSYKVGLLKRRTSVDHNYESDFGLETSTSNLDRDDYNRQNGGEYEVFGRNLYHVPQYVSAPSAIPPQYAPKDESMCDFYLGSPVPDATIRRSPLYGRRSKNSGSNIDYNIYAEETSSLERSLESLGFDDKKFPKLRAKSENNFSDLASNIERLQNDFSELDYEDFDVNYGDDMFGYYNSSCTAELDKILNSNNPRYKDSLWSDMERIRGITTCSQEDAQLANEIKRLGFDLKMDDDKRSSATGVQIETAKLDALPAVVSKKRMRCGQCNKRLNITNIYNCRCGRIFCSQHRYSETHDCKYDYKSEGRKLLEQQNPLVTATKLSKF